VPGSLAIANIASALACRSAACLSPFSATAWRLVEGASEERVGEATTATDVLTMGQVWAGNM
jgi:hypothetical protein